MKKTSILIFYIILSTSLFSQSHRVSKNVLSTSLFQSFAPEGGYTISYERMLDPGYSSNAAQFSYKMNFTLISSSDRRSVVKIAHKFFMIETLINIQDTLFYQNSNITLLGMLQWAFILLCMVAIPIILKHIRM